MIVDKKSATDVKIIGYLGASIKEHGPIKLRPICSYSRSKYLVESENADSIQMSKLDEDFFREEVESKTITLVDPIQLALENILYMHPEDGVKYVDSVAYEDDLDALLSKKRAEAWGHLLKNEKDSAKNLAYMLLRIDQKSADGISILNKLKEKEIEDLEKTINDLPEASE